MVAFNNKRLEDISNEIRILDVIVNPPSVRTTSIAPALADGETFARRQYGPRRVDVIFSVLENDPERHSQIMHSINQWAYSDQEKRLTVPQEQNGYLMAVCTDFPPDSARDYWEPVTLSFTCHSPYFRANFERSEDISNTIHINRADDPDWRIEFAISSALTSPTWGIGDKQLIFSSLAAGSLVLEKRTGTATLDGASVLPSLLLGSRFFQLRRGANTIDTQNGAGGRIFWRERWI